MQKHSPQAFLELVKKYPLVDVRSPKEFAAGHIPGAINIPIFDNDERAIVGTLYKQVGKQAAVLKGLEIVGPKMADFASQALALAIDNRILVHCWRGGMRSESMAWLFEKVGLQVDLLIGGYKCYRQFCVSQMREFSQLVVLKGFTGSGKTAILYELQKLGEQMIDLEGIANHRGSAFGGIGQGEQPTTEQFQNNLSQALSNLDPQQRVWVEGESKPIGRVYVPDAFWEQMQAAKVVEIVVPFEARVQRLVEDYAALDPKAMVEAIKHLEKRLGNMRMNTVIDVFKQKDYEATAAMLLQYYDKGYRLADKNYTHSIQKVEVTSGAADLNAQALLSSLE